MRTIELKRSTPESRTRWNMRWVLLILAAGPPSFQPLAKKPLVLLVQINRNELLAQHASARSYVSLIGAWSKTSSRKLVGFVSGVVARYDLKLGDATPTRVMYDQYKTDPQDPYVAMRHRSGSLKLIQGSLFRGAPLVKSVATVTEALGFQAYKAKCLLALVSGNEMSIPSKIRWPLCTNKLQNKTHI